MNPALRTVPDTAQAAKKLRIQYLVIGLAVAGLWLLNRDKALLYHAVQMTAVMTVLTSLQLVLQSRVAGAPTSLGVCAGLFGRLLGAKLALVAIAVVAKWLLRPLTSCSDDIVAALLVALVAGVGPVVDRHATSESVRRS